MPPKPHHHAGGHIYQTPAGHWRAQISHHGELIRRVWPTLDEAKGWLSSISLNLERISDPLTPAEYYDAQRALAELPDGVTLLDAALQYRAIRCDVTAICTLDAVARFLADKEDAGLRPRTRRELGYMLARLPGDTNAHEITTDALAGLLRGMSPVSRNNHIRAWRNFFGWCQRRGHVREIPTDGLTRAVEQAQAPGILTPADARKLLDAAREHDAGLIPFLAIGMFAGLRTAELRRLTSGAIGVDHIHVSADVAKVRVQRYTLISPNLHAWLDAYQTSGPIVGANHAKRLAAIQDAAKVHPPRNAMRHSFASYHLALWQDAGKTAHELGHRDAEMLFGHYRNLVTPDAAREWFEIRP